MDVNYEDKSKLFCGCVLESVLLIAGVVFFLRNMTSAETGSPSCLTRFTRLQEQSVTDQGEKYSPLLCR